jgi:hypothetical protein
MGGGSSPLPAAFFMAQRLGVSWRDSSVSIFFDGWRSYFFDDNVLVTTTY